MLEFHPIANIFPMIEGDDFAAFADDIFNAGVLLEKIVILDGLILDGRNRYRALLSLDWIDDDDEVGTLIEDHPEWFIDWVDVEDTGAMTPFDWVISKNAQRRHETPSQRALSAARIESFRHGGVRKPTAEQDADLQLDRGKASEIMHVSERSVASASVVLGQGVPELVKAVEGGKVSVSAAEGFARLPQPEQHARVEQSGGDVAQAVKQQRKAPEPAAGSKLQPAQNTADEPQPHEVDCPHCRGTGKVMMTPAATALSALENLRAAKGKPVKPSLTFDERQAFETSRLLALVDSVPDKLTDLQREYDVSQAALDYAMRDADRDGARQLHDRMQGLLLKSNGGTLMGLSVNKRPSGIRSANNQGGNIILTWGQEGSLWIKGDALNVIVTAGPWRADGAFSVGFYAVDPAATFISKTGYRNLPQVDPFDFGAMSLEEALTSIYLTFDGRDVLPETTYRLGRTGPVPVRKGAA